MDKIRVPKIEGVLCAKGGVTLPGTLHLTAHHLIFNYDEGKQPEMWVPYPLISLVTRLPQTLLGQSPLAFSCRTFETFTISCVKESDAMDVFESVKELTVATSVNQLYAFYYTPNPPFNVNDGWSLYSPRDEFVRMGVGSRTKAWRFTDINKEYSLCSTYPARIVVPTKISDSTLQHAAKYRSKGRIPVLAYLHWANYGSITRCSQPLVGISQNRSIQDEKLVEAIFQSHWAPESRATTVYGATSTNLIMDARPTTNAVANTARGAGTENMDHYKEGKKVYLGIDNIHTMRESLSKVFDALKEAEAMAASINNDLPGQGVHLSLLDRQALRRSGWLRHLANILEGTVLLVRNVHVNSSHVLIHCSDGWDRTSQLSSLSQLCLDPYYRTVRGFQVLVEKDWLGFGHKFLDRCGHLSSDKFFVAPTENAAGGNDGKQALAFFASVQNRIISPHHIKETSPVFHQFLESVRQVQRQFPNRFEFNERFLHKLYYHLYSCQFGTFLYNTEQERRTSESGLSPPCERTISVWDLFNSAPEAEKNLNQDYDPSLDDPASRLPKADMGVLFPNPKDVRFWHELYGRSDEEMNGRAVTLQVREGGVEFVAPVEGLEDDPVLRASTPSKAIPPRSPGRSPPPMMSPPRSMTVSRSQTPPQSSQLQGLRGSMPDLFSTGRDDLASPSTSPGRPTSPGANSFSTPFNRSRAAAKPDAGASNGVMSIWGKLSSNASNAFSVVQEAYGGVTKDFKGVSPSPGSQDGELVEKTSELRSRDNLGGWEDAEPSSSRPPPAHAASLGPSNPWAVRADSVRDAVASADNPWSPVRATSLQSATPIQELFNPLSPDPAIRPSPTRGNSQRAASPVPLFGSSSDNVPPRPAATKQATVPPPALPDSNTDPLGVGLW
ncbi:phosphatases II [Athelia psychrophila]|uniref:Phosphatases II n=1 Tax=Athelia psychrophila TaxID=1759441 RepID=A0A166JUH3_9AGAM|nr:phosphatases II [Fibularhizoctonia sp. CBS 109695]